MPNQRKFKAVEVRQGKWAVIGYHRNKKWYTSKYEGRFPLYTLEMAQELLGCINQM